MAHGQALSKLSDPINEFDHIIGEKNADIEIVEYADFECEYCSRANLVLNDLRETIESKIKYVYRHFPLSKIHPHAQLASEASEAAAAQGKFWEMHKELFNNQNNLTESLIYEIAEKINLDMDQFKKEMKNRLYAKNVREDFLSGIKSGVNGTPTLFINGLRYNGAWDIESLLEVIEKPLGVRIRLLTQEFTRLSAAGGIMLLIFTLIALILSNSPFGTDYFHLWETNIIFSIENIHVGEHLLEWINDGLMAIFFFIVGLEIKREFTVGELSGYKKALLPVTAAIGGMVFPAFLFILFNFNDIDSSKGWGIPMATDIAFMIVILTVIGNNRIPLSLKVFFSTLAIVDDLGSVVVIALFYSSNISINFIFIAFLIFIGLIALNRARIFWGIPYLVLGIFMWIAFLESGIHPTVAGVLLAITIPTRSPPNTKALLTQCINLIDEYEGSPVEASNRREAVIQTLETITDRLQSPAQRLERDLQPWVTYFILPIFALANTGIILSLGIIDHLLQPLSIGIFFGLVIGKPLGIVIATFLCIKIVKAELPNQVKWPQFVSVSFLAGIGFTMSLFITNASFTDATLLSTAKIGILLASITATIIGTALILLTSPKLNETSQLDLDVVPSQ
ncbi:MAG: Na+/H+ antiporter NhaA [Candidatus Thorarchaeota archaeon]